jgi:predicted metal-dependent hydrolase
LNSKLILIPEIGEVSITKRSQCKRLSISVNRHKEVKVSIPLRVSFNEGERFLFERIDWIKKSITKIENQRPEETLITESIDFSTRMRKLKIFPSAETKFKLRLTHNEILLSYPNLHRIDSPITQSAFKKLITEGMRAEAKEYLPVRVSYLAALHGFKYQNVSIKNATTRWGSCSYSNNINLNLNLIRLPDELSDYIILHELCHTVQKNHGYKFWELLERVSSNAKGKAQQLRKFKLSQF